jgi:16S rRNA (guanine527-N7)-methyltransferase
VDPSFDRLAAACSQLGVALTPEHYHRFCRYASLVREYNSRINLISRRDTERIVTYHIVDSLAAARFVPPQARCCDIGTGAGLPGIPLSVARPDVKMFLVESVQKKCRFLVHAVRELALAGTEVLCARAEATPPLACDVVLSRLTGPPFRAFPVLARHARPGGIVILYKNPAGGEPAPSLLGKAGLAVVRSESLTLPLTSVPRRFLVLKHGTAGS